MADILSCFTGAVFMNTLVCNIYSGPGCGKSTLAAEVFAELKKQGQSVELVHEFAKKWAWLDHPIKGWADNFYVFSKQLRSEAILYGKVEYIVTDSPLGLAPAYEKLYTPENTLLWDTYTRVREMQAKEGTVENLNFHLMRQFDYKSEGRYENEEFALKADQIIRSMHHGFHVKTAKDVLEVLVHHRRDQKT